MRDIDTALGHQLYQVSIAEFVSDIPTDTDNDNCAVEVAAAKQGRYVRRRRLIHANDYQPDLAFAPEPFDPPSRAPEQAERLLSMPLSFQFPRPRRKPGRKKRRKRIAGQSLVE
jgi:hypothetical protein